MYPARGPKPAQPGCALRVGCMRGTSQGIRFIRDGYSPLRAGPGKEASCGSAFVAASLSEKAVESCGHGDVSGAGGLAEYLPHGAGGGGRDAHEFLGRTLTCTPCAAGVRRDSHGRARQPTPRPDCQPGEDTLVGWRPAQPARPAAGARSAIALLRSQHDTRDSQRRSIRLRLPESAQARPCAGRGGSRRAETGSV